MQDGRHAEAARRTSMDRTHDDLAFVAGQRSRLRASAKRRKLPSGPLPSLRVTKSAGALPGLSGPLSAGPAFPPGGKMSRAVGGRAGGRAPPAAPPPLLAAWGEDSAAFASSGPGGADGAFALQSPSGSSANPASSPLKGRGKGRGKGKGGAASLPFPAGPSGDALALRGAMPGYSMGSTSHTDGLDYLSQQLLTAFGPGPAHDVAGDSGAPKPLGFFPTARRPAFGEEAGGGGGGGGVTEESRTNGGRRRKRQWELDILAGHGGGAAATRGNATAGIFRLQAATTGGARRPGLQLDSRAATAGASGAHGSGHVYFGSAWDLGTARAKALRELSAGTHPCAALRGAVARGGIASIEFVVVRRMPALPRRFDSKELTAALEAALAEARAKYTRKMARRLMKCYRRGVLTGGTGGQLGAGALLLRGDRWDDASGRYRGVGVGVGGGGGGGGDVVAAVMDVAHEGESLGAWWVWVQLVMRQRAQEREAAAIELQAFARGAHGKMRYRRRRRRAAAALITRAYRGHRGRSVARRKRWRKLAVLAMALIQRVYRGFLGRQRAWHKNMRRRRARGAAFLQRVWRGRCGRKVARKAARRAAAHAATVRLQRLWRGTVGRALAAELRAAPRRHAAAAAIARVWRGRCGRLRHARLTVQYAREALEFASARALQRCWRGVLGRLLHGEALRQRRTRCTVARALDFDGRRGGTARCTAAAAAAAAAAAERGGEAGGGGGGGGGGAGKRCGWEGGAQDRCSG